ncbi:NADP-dependent oxidoreductase [Demequina sp. NBRC 110057]|uniref:NADP-dependent oxidoreductase n=1 Tax=Demequina sp. NBRC 110057 TaxID=1570346 RepID=UPI0009FDAE3C|nr:NADP-dependent oxidoreductase [Demequina sp. NBRC 110057]
MKAIAYSAFGGPEVLSVTDLPDPHPGPDSVVVEVHAAAINPVDNYLRGGHLDGVLDTHFPAVPGWDVAGVVVQTGLDTPEFSVGDKVFAYARKDVVGGGTLAERVALPVRTAALAPRSLSLVEAAAVPLTGLTALQTLRRAGVTEGDRVLIHGAAGGVGTFGVQIARHLGAHVVGTASAANHDYVCDLGAEPVEYGEHLVEHASEHAPEGFDKIIDFAGGASLDSAAALLAPTGTVASIADARAATELGGHYVWVRPSSEDLATLAGLIDDGHVRVEVARTYPLEQAAEAYRDLAGGHTRGKIVVTVR